MNNKPDSSEFGLFGLTMLPEIGSVFFKPEMESTNTEALEMGKVGKDELPALVLTDSQTNGRGRDDNQWESASGSLTFTLALDRRNGPQVSPMLLSLSAGLSIHNALAELAPSLDVKLKWPNDVYVGDKKIAGVLIESNKKVTAVGIGINVNNSKVPKSGTTLNTETTKEFELQQVLVAVVSHFFNALEASLNSPEAMVESAQTKMLHYQKSVSIFTENRTVTGINTGLGPDGELLLKTDSENGDDSGLQPELKIVSGKNLKLT